MRMDGYQRMVASELHNLWPPEETENTHPLPDVLWFWESTHEHEVKPAHYLTIEY
jgi:hypothetical protein